MESIQARNARRGDVEQRRVALRAFIRRVRPVGKHREVKLGLRGSEVVDLEALDVLLNGRARSQQRRHHDHGAQMRRDAFA